MIDGIFDADHARTDHTLSATILYSNAIFIQYSGVRCGTRSDAINIQIFI